MKYKCLFLLLCIGLNTLAQIKFEKGYFISKNGTKTECLIKNEDWYNNPSNFEYKLNEAAITKNGTLETIDEFSVYGISKFQNHKVQIDRSTANTNKLTNSRISNFNTETLFLKLVIAGSANLYAYKDDNLIRYFFDKGTGEVEQLEYKMYETKEQNIAYNRNYRLQLKQYLSCNNTKGAHNISYTERSLSKYFIKYNSCDDNNLATVFSEGANPIDVIVKIKAGISAAELKVNASPFPRDPALDSKLDVTFGFEVEYILPFNKNKWSVFIDPTYQSYASKKTISYEEYNAGITATKTSAISFKYQSLSIPIGFKHYSFINTNHKLFFSLAFALNFPNKSTFVYTYNKKDSYELEVVTSPNFILGLGYQYDRYSIETKFNTPVNILSKNVDYDTKFQAVSFTLGYRIF